MQRATARDCFSAHRSRAKQWLVVRPATSHACGRVQFQTASISPDSSQVFPPHVAQQATHSGVAPVALQHQSLDSPLLRDSSHRVEKPRRQATPAPAGVG